MSSLTPRPASALLDLEAFEPTPANPVSESVSRDRRPDWVSRHPELCHYPYQGRKDDIDPAISEAEADNAQAEAHYAEQSRLEETEREEAELQAAVDAAWDEPAYRWLPRSYIEGAFRVGGCLPEPGDPSEEQLDAEYADRNLMCGPF